MRSSFRFILRELVIVLVIFLSGLAFFYTGAHFSKIYKERYWSDVVVHRAEYAALSLQEQDKAHAQFMALWALKLSDAPLREGGWGIRLAFGAQVVGAWLKDSWLILYAVFVFFRFGFYLKAKRRERAKIKATFGQRLIGEAYLLGFFLLGALAWYLAWKFLVPSAYVFYKRFVAGSYEYLWDARSVDLAGLAKFWPYVILAYPVTSIFRFWHWLTRGRRAR